MISVEEAKSLIAAYTAPLSTVPVEVANSAGHVLAEDVLSHIDMPPFPQSAMDGYALGIGPKTAESKFRLIGEVAAGSPVHYAKNKRMRSDFYRSSSSGKCYSCCAARMD